MRRRAILPLLAACALAACGAEPAAADAPARGAGSGAAAAIPALTGRVMDQAEILSPAAETELTATLAALERDTTDQLVVVTVPNLEGEPIEELGRRLGNGWGVGRKDVDNGALLIVAPNDRRVRIEVGTGLEGLLTNRRAKAIIEESLLPLFVADEYEQAVRTGVGEIAAVLRSETRRPQRRRGV